MEKDVVVIEYPAIFTTSPSDEVTIKLLCFKKSFIGADKLEAVTKAKRFLLRAIVEFKSTGKPAKEFMSCYPVDTVEELSRYLGSTDTIEYLSDEFSDDLDEFEEFTMFHIRRLEASDIDNIDGDTLII